eukprot:6187618-Pleurochrysis_carterae.AAC.2
MASAAAALRRGTLGRCQVSERPWRSDFVFERVRHVPFGCGVARSLILMACNSLPVNRRVIYKC